MKDGFGVKMGSEEKGREYRDTGGGKKLILMVILVLEQYMHKIQILITFKNHGSIIK